MDEEAYAVYHHAHKGAVPRKVQENRGVRLRTVLLQVAAMAQVGQYKVYDVTNFSRLVATITHKSFFEKRKKND